MNYKRTLQTVLVAVAAYDVYLAALGLFFRDQAVINAANFFNFNLEMSTSVYWLIGLVSTYLLAFAAFLLLAASDPVKYMHVIYICLGLFAVRIAQRVYFLMAAANDSSLVANPGIDYNLISIIVCAVLILFLALKIRRA